MFLEIPIFFYFVAQTGVISDKRPRVSNYYVYSIRTSKRAKVQAAVDAAEVTSTGLQYPSEFVQWLNGVDTQ